MSCRSLVLFTGTRGLGFRAPYSAKVIRYLHPLVLGWSLTSTSGLILVHDIARKLRTAQVRMYQQLEIMLQST